MRRSIALGFVLATALVDARAADAKTFIDGDRLLHRCTATGPALAECDDYIRGVADDLVGGAQDGHRVCVRPRLAARELRDIVVRYLAANPPPRDASATDFVAAALERAFPCR